MGICSRGQFRCAVVLGALLLLALVPAATPAQAAVATTRIFGGTPPTRQWPAQGFLEIAPNRICAGTLVSGRWFLTAGHCVTVPGTTTRLAPTAFRVNLGESDRTQFSGPERFDVDRVALDPLYARRTMSSTHDVALLHLARPTEASVAFEPMRIVTAAESGLWGPGTVATVVGWGASVKDGPLATTLQQAGVPILTDQTCGAAYPLLDPDPFDVLAMFCAGDGTADTCTGDSGGPIMVPRGDTFVLAGVTSYGLDCGNSAKPGVYARVGAPVINQWVRSQIPTAAISISPARPDPGTQVTLTASGQPLLAARTYAWDLDDDGRYDDDFGPTVTLDRIDPGSTVVRVEETYIDGDRALAREVVTTAGSPLPLPPPPPPPPPKPAPPATAADAAVSAPVSGSSAKRSALARLLPGPRIIHVRSLLDGRMTIGVRCSAACSLTARFTLDGRTAGRLGLTRFGGNVLMGTGSTRLRTAGSVKLSIRLTKRSVRALRRASSGATRVRVTARAPKRQLRLERSIRLHR
jgi:secreted trypsin-like serine protease